MRGAFAVVLAATTVLLIEPATAQTAPPECVSFTPAPALPDGVGEQSFTSSWRVWMHTRYVGPPVHITFTVRRGE